MNTAIEGIGVKLASALLLQYWELSIEDIRAIPFFTQSSQAETVIRNLLESSNVEVFCRQISSYPTPEWEQVIRLRELEI